MNLNKMKNNQSKYHNLYSLIKEDRYNLDDSNYNKSLEIVKELYEEHKKLEKKLASLTGEYGIQFKTIHDDSSYSDTDHVFFLTKSERDCVFECWVSDSNYDKLFEETNFYERPSPNLHSVIKVFKKNNKIYEE